MFCVLAVLGASLGAGGSTRALAQGAAVSDLAVTEVVISPESPVRGAPARVTVAYENRGTVERVVRLEADLGSALLVGSQVALEPVASGGIGASSKLRGPSQRLLPGGKQSAELDLILPEMDFGTLSLVFRLVDQKSLDAIAVNFSVEPIWESRGGRISWAHFLLVIIAGVALTVTACWPLHKAWGASAGRSRTRSVSVALFVVMVLFGVGFSFAVYDDLRVWAEYQGTQCRVTDRVVRPYGAVRASSAATNQNTATLYRALLALQLRLPTGDVPVVWGDGDAGRESSAPADVMQGRVSAWPPGSIVDCWYDPQDSRSVLLSRSGDLGIYGYMAVWWGLLFWLSIVIGRVGQRSEPVVAVVRPVSGDETLIALAHPLLRKAAARAAEKSPGVIVKRGDDYFVALNRIKNLDDRREAESLFKALANDESVDPMAIAGLARRIF